MSRWRERMATVEFVALLAISILALLQLAACSSSAAVSNGDREAAVAFVRRDQAPLPVKPVAMWYASADQGGMVCGEIEAPAALKPKHATLRYIFDPRSKVEQVEMHELWTTASAASARLIETNRMIFDGLWSQYCQPYAPLSRRMGRWFGR